MDINIHESNLGEFILVNLSELVENNSMHQNDLDDSEVDLKLGNDDVDDIAKRVHQFYFVKFYEDQELKARIEDAEDLVKTYADQYDQISKDLEELKVDQSRLNNWWEREDVHMSIKIGWKTFELKLIQQYLDRLSFDAQNANRGRRKRLLYSPKIDSIEEHNDTKFEKSPYRMLHESKNLAEEKKILREIIKQPEGIKEQQPQPTAAQKSNAKQHLERAQKSNAKQHLERTRTSYPYNCGRENRGLMYITIDWHSLRSRRTIRDQIRLKEMEIDELRKKHGEHRTKAIFSQLEEEKNKKEKQLIKVHQRKHEVQDYIFELRKQNEATSACYNKFISVLNHARELADNKDLAALEKLSRKQVDKFMSQWSSNNAFRKDYEKIIVPSLDGRNLSRDGLSKTSKRSLRL